MSNTQFTSTRSSTYIGVDIGGTNTRIGLFGSQDTADFIHIARYHTYQSYKEQHHRIIAAIRASNVLYLEGIAVSVAARVARDARSTRVAPTLPDCVNHTFAT